MHGVRVAAAVGAWLALALVVSLLTGLARTGWAWLGMGLLFLVVPSQLAWQLSHRRGRVRVPVALSLVVGLLAAALAASVTPLSTADLERVERRFVLPDSWALDGQQRSGRPLCLDTCPTVQWRWSTDDAPSVAAVDAVAVLRSAGFRVVVREDGSAAAIDARSGRVELDGRVAPAPDRPATSVVTFTLTSRR